MSRIKLPSNTVGVMAKSYGVYGAGAWGTALAVHLAKQGHSVILFARDINQVGAINSTRRNPKIFKDIILPENIFATSEFNALEKVDRCLVSVSSTVALEAANRLLRETSAKIIMTTKGLDKETCQPFSKMITEADRYFLLSGPSFADEVIAGLPTAVTLSSTNVEELSVISKEIHSKLLRVYSSTDVIGAEIGGSVKNIIAIASGVVDGAGLGRNARAALVTRGLHEMRRLALAMGARQETLSGLSGLGDLLLTATSAQSRNYKAGQLLGMGKKCSDLGSEIIGVIEGIHNAPLVRKLAREYGVELPIVDVVNMLLNEDISLSEGIDLLMSRTQKDEANL